LLFKDSEERRKRGEEEGGTRCNLVSCYSFSGVPKKGKKEGGGREAFDVLCGDWKRRREKRGKNKRKKKTTWESAIFPNTFKRVYKKRRGGGEGMQLGGRKGAISNAFDLKFLAIIHPPKRRKKKEGGGGGKEKRYEREGKPISPVHLVQHSQIRNQKGRKKRKEKERN